MRRRRAVALAAAAFAASFAVAPAAAGTLEVVVRGIRSDEGTVRMALHGSPKTFPKKGAGLKRAVPAENGEIEATFEGLEPGRYALAFFHDEDGDDEFDQGFLGIPLEGYGFSNNARPFLGPPSFGKAAVEVGSGRTKIIVDMMY